MHLHGARDIQVTLVHDEGEFGSAGCILDKCIDMKYRMKFVLYQLMYAMFYG